MTWASGAIAREWQTPRYHSQSSHITWAEPVGRSNDCSLRSLYLIRPQVSWGVVPPHLNEAVKELEATIAAVLKPLGYTKRARTWHRERESVISVLNLQISQWGDECYINLGVYVKSLGGLAQPNEA